MLKIKDSYIHKGQRRALVEVIKKKGIKSEAVLKAMNTFPRHFFFDSALHSHAYEDKAFPIGERQTISQPYTVAFQTELLQIVPGDKVLEIGTGSGYQASILYLMGAEVHSIEVKEKLYAKAKKFLQQLGIAVKFYLGDGSKGIPEKAPFDKILVTAGAPVIPNNLIQQLKVGGILVIPVGDRHTQKMLRLTKISDHQMEKEEFNCFSFVPLLGEEGWD
jgi:protein-L-isoaspartate(D-aspartate) O-methyltransferase